MDRCATFRSAGVREKRICDMAGGVGVGVGGVGEIGRGRPEVCRS